MNLFLDDQRNPEDCLSYVLGIRLDVYKEDWAIVRDYNSFVAFVEVNGIPDVVSFDHDLADEHYNIKMHYDPKEYNRLYEHFKERTGYDACKWLINHCIQKGARIPVIYCHSMNPVGRENINKYVENAIKHLE